MNDILNLLYDSKPLVINPKLAVEIGLNEAIILQQIKYWCDKNKSDNRNFHDGYYWCFNSYEGWKDNFPFFSASTIKRTILNLEKLGLIVSGNYNKIKIDKTKWYRLNQCIDQPSGQNDLSNGPNWPNERTKLNKPIPEINTDNNKTSPDVEVTKPKKTLSDKDKQNIEAFERILKINADNNYIVNPDSKLKGYIYGAIKREGPERVVKAVKEYWKDKNSGNKFAGKFDTLFYKAGRLADYANKNDNGISDSTIEAMEKFYANK